MYNRHTDFEFDVTKEQKNIRKHGVDFRVAQEVFIDPDALYLRDLQHSGIEERYFAVGKVRDGRVITVWYTWRNDKIRIIGAAHLRRWRKEYEKGKVT